MIVIERRNRIKEMLYRQRSVKVSELARDFGVSEETVRRDLNQLEQEGLIKKNYGGAILLEEIENVPVPPVQQRKLQYFEEKNAIGAMAASLLDKRQIVIVDAGSTTWCMARHLRQVPELTVVTNGVNIAEECAHNEEASIFLVGGKLVTKSMSLVGPQAELELQRFSAHYVFLGISGIAPGKGFTSSDIYEAEVKRAMIAAGHKVVILADHSKFERQGLVSFSEFRDADVVITSDLADPEALAEIRGQGVQVVVCPVANPAKEESE